VIFSLKVGNRNKKISNPISIPTSSNVKSVFGSKISQDFLNLVKLQKKGAFLHNESNENRDKIIRMNLVNVNLDYDVIYSP